MEKSNHITMTDEKVTIEYLLSHGFVEYKSPEEGDVHEIPFEGNSDTLHFREIEFSRHMCVVLFSPWNGDVAEGYNVHVYFQDDVGCGFVQIPFPWAELSVEFFESVYYGIHGEKPKLNSVSFENAEYEIIPNKQITNE